MIADTVFTYSYLFCVAAFACAMAAYAAMRKKSPDLAWHRHGKVSTTQFNELDILGVGLFLLIFGAILTLAQTPPEYGPDGELKEVRITPLIMIAGMISQQVVFVLIVFGLLMFRNADFMQLFGLRSSKPIRVLVVGLTGFAIYYISTILLHMGGYEDWLKETFDQDSKLQETVKTYREVDAVAIRLMMAFTLVILAPVCEEILFRGYIYGATKRFSDRFFACLFSALLFAVVHYNINALIPLFLLAIILAIAYELTGSLWTPVMIHACVNANTLIVLEFANIPGN